MGEIADCYITKAINQDVVYYEKFINETEEERPEDAAIVDYEMSYNVLIWQTKAGRLIHISDMSNAHLRNAIKYFRINESYSAKYWRKLWKIELECRA